jgi:hypothetical protein
MKNARRNRLAAWLATILLAAAGGVLGCGSRDANPPGDVDSGATDPGTETVDVLDTQQPDDAPHSIECPGPPEDPGADDSDLVDGAQEDPGQALMPLDCKTCNDDGDCRGGYECLPVVERTYCLRRCENGGDCPSGFLCYAASMTLKACLPVTYSCVACVFNEPCEEGRCCDFDSGECKDCRDLCDTCRYDFDCAKGLRCFKEAGNLSGGCVEECADRTCSDPANFTCGANASGVMVCQPNGAGCGDCPEGLYPLVATNACVECLNSSHCRTGEICNLTTHACEGAECPGGHKCDDGQCHQCCEDAHCGCDGGCRPGTCLPNYVCESCMCCNGACTGEYPVCATILGIEQCVQCVEDADCAARDLACTCTGDPLYSCVDGDGNPCPFPEPMEGERR